MMIKTRSGFLYCYFNCKHNTEEVWEREVNLVRESNHPNIVKILHAFRSKDVKEDDYIVFEYVEKNLLDFLKDSGELNEDSVRNFIFQIVSCCLFE